MLGLKKRQTNNNKQYTEKNILRILAERVPVSDYLAWLRCEEKEEFALYETIEGVGFIFEVYVPPFVGDSFEDNFRQLFRISYPNDTIITFFSYASQNISPYIDAYRYSHMHRPNVDSPELLFDLIQKRASYYEEAADKGFWPGVPYKPRIFRNFFSILVPFSTFNGNVTDTYNTVRSLVLRVKGALGAIKLSPYKCGGDSFRTLMKEIFNVNYKGLAQLDAHRDIRHQIIDYTTQVRIEEDRHGFTDIKVKQGRNSKYIRVYTITDFPRQNSLWDFNNILFSWDSKEIAPPIPSPFGISLSVKYTDWRRTKAKLQAKAAWAIKQTDDSLAARFIPKIRKKAEESKYVMELIEEGSVPLPCRLSVFLTEQDHNRLDYVSSELVNKMGVKGFELQREIDKAMFCTFLEMLPMNHIMERDDFLLRRSTLFDANIATLIPYIGGTSGSSSPAEMYVDRKGCLCFWDRFESDTNFNVVKVAESGGGKSFGQGNSHAHSLTMGRKVRVIDIGRSYEYFCKTVGGEYIEITKERNPCFNFFTNVIEDVPGQISEEEMDSMVPLVGFLCGLDVSVQISEDSKDNTTARYASIIIEAISEAYRKKGREAGLADVADELQDMQDPTGEKLPQRLYQAIYPYAKGIYSHYFNGENNIQYSKDYVVLELEEVEQKDARLQAAIIFSLIVKILREVYTNWKNHKQRTEVDIDEAWSIFKKVSAKSFMESAARRFRKYNSSICVITQGIDDMYETATTKAIWSNAAHKIYLQMPKEKIEKAIEEKKLVMSEFAKEWFKTLFTQKGKFSELYFNSPSAEGVMRLVTDRYSYLLLTTTAGEKIAIEKLAQELGVSVGRAIEMLTTEKKLFGRILYELGVPKLAINLALKYQMEQARDKKIGEILIEMGISEDIVKQALEKQEDYVTWIKKQVKEIFGN